MTFIPFRYKFRIGVTGHRELENPSAVADAVERALSWICDNCKTDSAHFNVDFSLISPLAEGADQIVATKGLALPNVKLEVVTPFPLNVYRQSFKETESEEAFQSLLHEANEIVELNGDPLTSQIAYGKVGQAVVDSCELLFVIYSPSHEHRSGGTKSTLTYAIEKQRNIVWINPKNPEDFCFAAEVDENGNPIPIDLPTTLKDLSLGLHQLHALAQSQEAASVNLSEHYVTNEFEDQLGRIADPVIADLLPYHVLFDQLADRFQDKHTRSSLFIHALAALSVSIVVFQVVFFPTQLWIIALEALAMVAALHTFHRSKREAWREKWLNDRFLAEQTRSALYTSLVNVDPTGWSQHARSSLPSYAGPEQWMLDVVRDLQTECSTQADRSSF